MWVSINQRHELEDYTLAAIEVHLLGEDSYQKPEAIQLDIQAGDGGFVGYRLLDLIPVKGKLCVSAS